MATELLEIKATDQAIYEAKIKLAEELACYDKVKNNEQVKDLVDFLEYLFLIEDKELEMKYEEYRKNKGGRFKMTIDEIRKMHYEQKGKEKGKEEGREEGREEERLEIAKKLLDILDDETIALKTGLPVEEVKKLRG